MRIKLLALLMLISTNAYAIPDYDGGGTADDNANCGSATTIDQLGVTSGGLTLSIWACPRTEGEASQGRFISKISAGAAGGWFITFSPLNENAFRFTRTGATNLVVTARDNSIALGKCQHLAATWTGGTTASTDVQLYNSGSVLVHSADQNGVTINSDAANSVFIGNVASDDRATDGRIMEVAVYEDDLTPQEIKRLASGTSGMPLQVRPEALRAYWPLRECSSKENCAGTDFFKDYSRYNHDCTPAGTPRPAGGQVSNP